MTDNKNIMLLKLLKEQYDKRTISVLIGSGFSKNALPYYPTWNELLKKLVMDLYGRKIKEDYSLQKRLFKHKTEAYKDFEQHKIDDIIDDVGYLNLVSQYISAKGYREAIDVYIEEHIPYISKDENGFDVSTNTCGTEFTKDDLEVHRELLLCNWKNVFTTNYDNLLELTNTVFDLNYERIVSDYELAKLSENRGIIKVHGSLVDNSLDSNFEFDNDTTRRYIISNDDYNTYTEKHQAFSYMMRTSLLTGVFCLIGFSGNDPNFLGWLEWMRDILDKDQEVNIKGDKGVRVYLLNVGEENIDKDRQLFYKNHRIGVINIKDSEFLKEIGLIDDVDIRTVFINFFKYLRRGSDVQYSGGAMTQYEKLWQGVLNNSASFEVVKQIRSIRNWQFIPKHTQRQYNYINYYLRDKGWDITNTELFAIAANDCGLTPTAFQSEKLSSLDEVPEWKQLILLESAYDCNDVLKDCELDDDLITYYRILRYLYLLQFDEAHNLLDKWPDDKDWVVCKSSLIADTNRSEAVASLEDYLRESNNMPMKYLAANLANILLGLYPPRYSYDEYRAQRLDNFWDKCNEIINNIRSTRRKIVPYGIADRTIYLSTDTTQIRESFKFLSLLAKTGFNLHYTGISIINANDWYLVFSNLFERYPYPCLYYSLQLDDNNILRRIGQDFSYSEELIEKLPDLLRRMLSVMKDNKYNIRLKSYYLICSEMFVAVPDKEWFSSFESVLCSVFLPNIDKLSNSDEISLFVKAATHRIQDESHIITILNKLLETVEDFNIYLISEIIYEMPLDKVKSRYCDFKDLITNVLQKYDIIKTYLLIAALYRYNLIDDSLRESISKMIVNNEEKVTGADHHVLFSLSHFTNKDPQSINIIKKSILKRDIWHCGINGNTGSSPQYIQLNKLSQDIVWTENEIDLIMKNLNYNVQLLKDSRFLDNHFLEKEYASLLVAMLDFVDNRVLDKLGLTKYSHLSLEIKNLLDSITPNSSSFDVLYNLEWDISSTLHYLARCIDYQGTEKYSEYINYLLYRALTKERKYLNLVLAFVEFIVTNHFEFMDNPEGLHKLELLLDTYSGVDYRELEINLPAMCRVMRNIAKYLSENKQMENKEIIYWLTNDRVNRFSEN